MRRMRRSWHSPFNACPLARATKNFIQATKISTVVARWATRRFGPSSQSRTTLELRNRRRIVLAENYVHCHVFINLCSAWIYHFVLITRFVTRDRVSFHIFSQSILALFLCSPPAYRKPSTNWVRRLNQLSLPRRSKVELYWIEFSTWVERRLHRPTRAQFANSEQKVLSRACEDRFKFK